MGIMITAPKDDVAILLVCFGLTVLFDMVLAVAVGIDLAGALFIRRMANLTQAQSRERALTGLPARMMIKPSRAGINKHVGTVAYCQSLEHACNVAIRWQPKH